MARTTKNTGKKSLTPKQARFVKEYLIDLNATQAAIRAGYSAKTAGAIAVENLTKPLIRDAVEKARGRTEQKLDLSRDRIMREYARVAFADIRNYGEWDASGRATMKPSTDLSSDETAAISELTVTTTETRDGDVAVVSKMKLAPKLAALDSLCKMQGYFVQRHELSGPGGTPLSVAVDLSSLSDDELRAAEAVAAIVAPVSTVESGTQEPADHSDDDEAGE